MSWNTKRKRRILSACAGILIGFSSTVSGVCAQSDLSEGDESFEEFADESSSVSDSSSWLADTSSKPFGYKEETRDKSDSEAVFEGDESLEVQTALPDAGDFADQSEETAQEGQALNLYRLYNPHTGEHFYTGSAAERGELIRVGWKDEKTAWSTPASGRPVYRLYNPNASDHHYTMDETERAHLIKAGWKDEGVRFYSRDEYGRSVYRLYNPNARSGAHHYTLSRKEADALVSKGWSDEGRSFYAISDYTFVKDEKSHKVSCRDAKGSLLKGRQKIYDDWYEFGADGWMKTGWIDEIENTPQDGADSTNAILESGTDDSAGGDTDDSFLSEEQNILSTESDFADHEQTVVSEESAEVTFQSEEEVLAEGQSAPANAKPVYRSRRCHDRFGRQLLGLSNVDGEWYCFEGENGSALFFREVTKDNRSFYFGQDGKALSGRFFLYPDMVDADGKGSLRHDDFGWKQAGANLHAMKARQAALQKKADAIRNTGSWNASNRDPSEQAVIAEWTVLEQVLKAIESDSIHSIYNPNSGEHFYTGDQKEIASLVKAGWKDEGIRFQQPKTSSTPVYRLYHRQSGDHHYTKEKGEVSALEKSGWKNEGICFYSAEHLSIPVYRLCNPNAKVGAHHYTDSRPERDALVEAGWRDESIGWSATGLYSIVKEDRNGKSGLAIYDPQNRRLYGLQEVYGERYYLDGSNEGFATTGPATISVDGRQRDVRFDAQGRMVFGEYKENGSLYYYERSNGEKARSKFVQYGSPAHVYWHNDNGARVFGHQNIKGRTFYFHEKTGVLSPDWNALKNQVVSQIDSTKSGGEQIAFALRVPGSDVEILYNSRPQYSASVMKVFVMGAVFENYDRYAAFMGKGRLDQQLSVMIRISDNEAWKNLVSTLGGGSYSAGLQVLRDWNVAHGYNDTQMTGALYGNFTSARDASKILKDIAEGKLKHSAQMKALLRSQAHPGRMLQGLPPEAVTGNKPGWIDGCENDTVLVDAPFGSYVVTLLCEHMQSSAQAKALMGRISPMVYGWMRDNMNIGKTIPNI